MQFPREVGQAPSAPVAQLRSSFQRLTKLMNHSPPPALRLCSGRFLKRAPFALHFQACWKNPPPSPSSSGKGSSLPPNRAPHSSIHFRHQKIPAPPPATPPTEPAAPHSPAAAIPSPDAPAGPSSGALHHPSAKVSGKIASNPLR